MPDRMTIHLDDEDDRFARLRLIEWWDQARLRAAKVMVVGAGALGNEIIKNLALLGIGNLLICDKDRIEHSNLSRSILFRAEDAGKSKALVAADAARRIYPDINVHGFDGDIVHDLGLGAFRWADLVLAGLDNRLARLTINRHCARLGKPWIDGAIERIQGVARVFLPGGPCYECTMSQRDWQALQARRSCNLLSRAEMEGGRTPTTPTISSIIAGVQCQEAIKLLHGMPTIGGKGWVFEGHSTEAFQTEYQRKGDCLSHDLLARVIELDATSDGISLRQVLERARREIGGVRSLELPRDVLEKLVCPRCQRAEFVGESLGKIKPERALCRHCGAERHVHLLNHISGDSPYMDHTPARMGLPPMDVLIARGDRQAIGLELTGDAPTVLGELFATGLEMQ